MHEVLVECICFYGKMALDLNPPEKSKAPTTTLALAGVASYLPT